VESTKSMQLSKITLTFIILLVSLSLSGCATLTKQKARPIDQQSRTKSLHEINKWKIQGRIGVTGEGQRGSANIIWSQDKDKYDMKIIAPIGTKKVMIKGDSNHIALKSSSGDNINSNEPTKAIYDNLGWYLPIEHLSHWIKGIPSPSQKFKWYPKENGKFIFVQTGWKVSFSLPNTSKDNSLPDLVVIDNYKTRIKISINKWLIN
jgi:outer membrane lipoprotein LolB